MFELPLNGIPEWEIRPLKDLTKKIGSGATPRGGKEVYKLEGTSFIRSQNVIDSGMLVRGIAFIDEASAESLKGVEVHENDVLLNITGDSIARCSLVDPSVLPARVNQHVAILRATHDLNPVFLQKYLVNPEFKAFMLSMSAGATRNALTKGQIEQFPILVPPRPVQDAIAGVLGALDDKIAVNNRIVESSLALADSHYEAARQAHSEDVDTSLGDLAESRHVEYGDGYRTKKPELGDSGIPILRVAEVQEFRINPSFGDYVREEFRSKMRGKVSKPGDIVVTTKGTVGRVAIIPEAACEFVYSPQVCYFRTTKSSPASPQVLFLWMRSRGFREQVAPLKGQTDMADYLSLGDIRSLKVPLFSAEIGPKISNIGGILLNRAKSSDAESRTLAALRDILLPQLMSGKLRVKDAEAIVEDAV